MDAHAESEPAPPGRDPAVPWHLLMLATPTIAGMISQTVISFVDFIMVSQLGTAAQAAIMPASLVVFVVIGFGIGLSIAVNTYVSQSLGAQRLEDCSAYAWQGLYLSFMLGAAVLPLWFLAEPFYTWAGHEPAVRELETVYTQIGVLMVFPATAAKTVMQFFNGIHRPWVGFVGAFAGNAVNVVANFALIFGYWGFPAMGVEGAAWASLLGHFVHLLVLFVWMLLPGVAGAYGVWRTWAVDRSKLLRLLWLGTPMGLQFTADILAWAFFMVLLVGRFGTAQLAASNIAFKCVELSFMPAVGIGVALTAAVGRSIGMKRHDLARRYVRWALIYVLGWMVALGLIMACFPRQMTALFTDQPEVILWGGYILLFCAVFQVFDAMHIVFISALRGAGDAHWPTGVFVLYVLLLLIGGGSLVAELRPDWQSLGPWAMATVYCVLLGVTLWARFVWGPWQSIDLQDNAPGDSGQIRPVDRDPGEADAPWMGQDSSQPIGPPAPGAAKPA